MYALADNSITPWDVWITGIEQTQPLFGCSGHIHESPYQAGAKWAARIGRTLWFQPGQEGERLHYVSLEVGDDLSIPTCRHSVFGAAAI